MPIYFETAWYDHGTLSVNKQELFLLYKISAFKSFFEGKYHINYFYLYF